jgi:hypothetical protein
MRGRIEAIAVTIGCLIGIYFLAKWISGDDGTTKIDPKLQPIVEEWITTMESSGMSDARERLGKVHQIKLASIETLSGPEPLGVTTIDGDVIKINERILNQDLMKNTLFHELGHALFRLDHTSEGIMNCSQDIDGPFPINDSDKLKQYIDQCLASR